ncbi:MAG: hypothetical protein EOP47_17060 [Sphingobacteriaceae bacterium]|nr:MAG: hypothetical protein EOP47_17060 [Sphingobacteriaceae bacterium]
MAVVVNPHNEEQEKALIAFLNNLEYEYQNTTDIVLTTQQEQEILRRDKDYTEGKTTARIWTDVKKDLETLYR